MGTNMKFRITLGSLLLLTGFAGFASAVSTHTFLNCNLPDTGQIASYTATFGEDHDYQPTGTRPGYTIYNPGGGSSVTVDNRTGLMWVTNPNDASIGGTYSWENAITACEGLTYATYSDWRLPNIKELVSIVDLSRQNPSINTTYFLNTQGSNYWSSTTYMPNTVDAWIMNFASGNIANQYKVNPIYVRCVRGGP